MNGTFEISYNNGGKYELDIYDDRALYVGGEFCEPVNGVSVDNVAIFDGTVWTGESRGYDGVGLSRSFKCPYCGGHSTRENLRGGIECSGCAAPI